MSAESPPKLGLRSSYREPTPEQLIRVAADVFNKRGWKMSGSAMSKAIRRGYRDGGIAGAIQLMRREIYRAHGEQSGRDMDRILVSALSLECRENPYVADWFTPLQGGLPHSAR